MSEPTHTSPDGTSLNDAGPGNLPFARIATRIAQVRERIDSAAERAGRDPADVRLVAVTKRHPVEAIEAARAAGVYDIAENYPQEMAAKAAVVSGVRWHLIGRLQRNKVKVPVECGALVHSVDSLPLARALGNRACSEQTTVRALVQVEADDRSAAHGVRLGDLKEFLEACRCIDGLEVLGLMVMPALDQSPATSRPAFARTAAYARSMGLRELSMGMSADFEVAVEEGATAVRVGSTIFGPRPR